MQEGARDLGSVTVCDGDPHRAAPLKYNVKIVTVLTVAHDVLMRLIKLVGDTVKDLLAVFFLEFSPLGKSKLTQLLGCEVYLHRRAISMNLLQYSLHLINELNLSMMMMFGMLLTLFAVARA